MKQKAETAKKRPGRKPMTEEQKKAAAEARAAEKAKAENMKPEVYVQYQDSESELFALIEAVKADFKRQKKRTLITELKVYVKPEERMAYYVINGSFTGSIPC
ncbi:MAG: hypothetical protein IJU66_01945 [Oscillospiraceae bacterium]|nr:hypothetical protein [Oscillospiraceae bacterium]